MKIMILLSVFLASLVTLAGEKNYDVADFDLDVNYEIIMQSTSREYDYVKSYLTQETELNSTVYLNLDALSSENVERLIYLMDSGKIITADGLRYNIKGVTFVLTTLYDPLEFIKIASHYQDRFELVEESETRGIRELTFSDLSYVENNELLDKRAELNRLEKDRLKQQIKLRSKQSGIHEAYVDNAIKNRLLKKELQFPQVSHFFLQNVLKMSCSRFFR